MPTGHTNESGLFFGFQGPTWDSAALTAQLQKHTDKDRKLVWFPVEFI